MRVFKYNVHMLDKEDIRKTPLVKIIWVDSNGYTDVWSKVDVYDDEYCMSQLNCVTVGFVLNQNKTTITVAGSLSNTGQASGVMTIPRCSITRIIKL